MFQFESQGMRDVLRQMRPDRFEDLIAAVESAPYAFSPWLGDQVREPALREALG